MDPEAGEIASFVLEMWKSHSSLPFCVDSFWSRIVVGEENMWSVAQLDYHPNKYSIAMF